MTNIIGVDVGGTRLRAARFDSDMTMLERVETFSGAQEGTDAVVDRLIALIQQVLPEDPGELQGIGMGVPGPIDPQAGLIIETPNLPWSNLPLVKLVRDAVGGTVRLGNDADVAALGEFYAGAAKGKNIQHMIYLTISTGIGGGIINAGKLLTGRGQGGEVGHIVVEPDGPPCTCGRRGHLEALASGTAIARLAREKLAQGAHSSLVGMADGNLDTIGTGMVARAAAEGDSFAIELIQSAGRYTGIGIASLMHLFNPEMFVIGGGVANVGNLLFDAIHEAVDEYVMHPRFAEGVPIVPAVLGGDAGLIGAALLVKPD